MTKRQIFKTRRSACPQPRRRLVLYLCENAAPERSSADVMDGTVLDGISLEDHDMLEMVGQDSRGDRAREPPMTTA